MRRTLLTGGLAAVGLAQEPLVKDSSAPNGLGNLRPSSETYTLPPSDSTSPVEHRRHEELALPFPPKLLLARALSTAVSGRVLLVGPRYGHMT
jgi:hypothetical protein